MLRLELAELQAATSSEDAIETLRSVLDEDPSQAQAVVLLSQLYEKAGQDEELAEFLSSKSSSPKIAGQRHRALAHRAAG